MNKPLIVVDSRIHIPGEVIAGMSRADLDALKEACTHENPAYQTWVSFRRGQGYPPPKTICTAKKDKGGGLWLPRGRMDAVEAAFGAGGYDVQDRRVVVPAPAVEWVGHQMRGYQERLIRYGLESCTKEWVNGVWRSAAGSGKTELLLNLVSRLRLRALVVVPTERIFDQWVARAKTSMKGVKPGIIKGSKRVVGEVVTIGMQQTLWNCAEEYAYQFGAVIADEAQLFAARTPREVIDAFPAVFRCAVSDDEQRSDGREFFTYDYFGPVTQVVTRDEAKGSGGIVDVEVVVVPTDFRADWYKKLAPSDKFERRHELLEAMTADAQRNELIRKLAVDVRAESGLQVAVLSQHVEHCEKLAHGFSSHGDACVLLTGEEKGFDENVAYFAGGHCSFAVGTFKKIGVGFESHRELARGIFASPVVSKDGSRMQFYQFLGRFARPAEGKNKGVVYYPLDVHVFGKRPATFIHKWLKEKSFALVGGRMIPLRDWIKSKDHDETTSSQERSGDGQGDFFGDF